jgi:HD-like signal output (HDOD) protein
MASIMLISENVRETQVLKVAFEQKNIKVLCSTPDYRNYIKILQYLPDAIFIEFPKMAHSQLHFVEVLKTQKKTKNIPIISYGDKIDDAMKKGLLDKGILYYINRPLKFSIILSTLEKNLKYLNKGLDLPKEQPSDLAKDIELILSNQTLATKKIEVMTSYIVKVMAFPFTVAKVLKLADSEKSAAGDLAKVIQADPVISAQLLKISNSVLFASMNRRIAAVKDAIIRVGFKETRRLVMSMSVMKLFGETDKNIGFDRKAFWFHSLVCGIISERLAKQMGTVNTDEAFLAGILHDFGILILDEFFPLIFSRILEDTANKNTQFILSEKNMLGITHNDVVGQLFAQWKLPDSVTEGIMGQYQFTGYANNLDSPNKKIALCVGVSDILAKTVGFGKECDRFITPIPNWVFESVRMPAGISDVFLDDVNHQIVLYQEFLKLDNKGAGSSSQEKETTGKPTIGVINHAKDIFVPPLHYLINEGYEVAPLSLNAKDAETNSLNEVVIWAGAAITPDVIAQASKMVKSKAPTPNSSASAGKAAVVVCSDESQTTELPDVRFLKKSFDLRQLDI